MALNPKPDPVLSELGTLCMNAESAPLKASAVEAISRILEKGATKKKEFVILVNILCLTSCISCFV